MLQHLHFLCFIFGNFFCSFVLSYSILLAFILAHFMVISVLDNLFSNELKKRKDMELYGWRSGVDLGGVGRGKTITRIYHIKIYFQ